MTNIPLIVHKEDTGLNGFVELWEIMQLNAVKFKREMHFLDEFGWNWLSNSPRGRWTQ